MVWCRAERGTLPGFAWDACGTPAQPDTTDLTTRPVTALLDRWDAAGRVVARRRVA
jgi:hypothetical protein